MKTRTFTLPRIDVTITSKEYPDGFRATCNFTCPNWFTTSFVKPADKAFITEKEAIKNAISMRMDEVKNAIIERKGNCLNEIYLFNYLTEVFNQY